jgi:type II secretory pathway component GspD/PulD (secretin)
VSKGYGGNPELYSSDGNPVVSAGEGEYTPVKGETHEQMVANALLIAAAPKLLWALQELLDKVDHKRYNICEDFDFVLADAEARNAVSEATEE